MDLPYLSIRMGGKDYLLMGDDMLFKVYSSNVENPQGGTILCQKGLKIGTLINNLREGYQASLPLNNVILMIGTRDLCSSNLNSIDAYSEGAIITAKIDELREELEKYKIDRLVIVAIPIIPRYEQLPGFHMMWCIVNSYIE